MFRVFGQLRKFFQKSFLPAQTQAKAYETPTPVLFERDKRPMRYRAWDNHRGMKKKNRRWVHDGRTRNKHRPCKAMRQAAIANGAWSGG